MVLVSIIYFYLFRCGIYFQDEHCYVHQLKYIFFFCACFLNFFLASVYQVKWVEFFDRRLISFLLYLTMFALCFVPITDRNHNAFKLSIVISGLILSLWSLIVFISLGAEAQAFESKDIVGSQRYGFVYILGFWILWYDKKFINSLLFRMIWLTVLVLGIALTFSRSSLVAFMASSIFALVHSFSSNSQSSVKWLKNLTVGLGFGAFVFFALYLIAPIVFEFFWARLFEYFLSGSALEAVADPATSDGTRIYIWSHISQFVAHNPITGSGFLGVWVLNLFGDFSGSSHNQYFDALFRLGPVLFIFYLYFLLKIWSHFKSKDAGIFIGYSGILFYGLFHETFKESHGMFILAMLLSISLQRQLLIIYSDRKKNDSQHFEKLL